MYRCQTCNRVVPPRTPAHRLVAESRRAAYPFRPEVHRVVYYTLDGKKKVKFINDKGGFGVEVAKEMVVCPHCANQLRQN